MLTDLFAANILPGRRQLLCRSHEIKNRLRSSLRSEIRLTRAAEQGEDSLANDGRNREANVRYNHHPNARLSNRVIEIHAKSMKLVSLGDKSID